MDEQDQIPGVSGPCVGADANPGRRREPNHVPIDFGAADDLQRSTFGRTAAELSQRHHLRCSVRLSRRTSASAGAVTNVVNRRIMVHPAVLEENDAEQAWTAAHEVGHLVDARTMGLRRYLPWGFLGMLPVTVASMFVPVLLIDLIPLHHQPI